MKKLIILFFIFTFSITSFASLKAKHVKGEWTYNVMLGNEAVTGVFKFELEQGKLSGKAISTEGKVYPLTKIEIKKDNTLCFELQRENDVSIVFVLTANKNEFKGKGWINDASITGKKQKTEAE